MNPAFPDVNPRQQELLTAWLPRAEVMANHSWGLIGTTVLEAVHDGERFIVKAGDASDHHLTREIRAHREWLSAWTSAGRAPRLIHADEAAKLLVTRFLPGELVQGTEAEHLPDTYRQAGELLAQLHQQLAAVDEEFEARLNHKTLGLLDTPHRIDPEVARRLRGELESWPTPASTVVPTHGDWGPRNWLMHDGAVRVIDFGRAELRPPMTDLVRLASRQFRQTPGLEAAFLAGYGSDPRELPAWRRAMIREAIATAVWAHQVGDHPFEQLGHRMIADVLANS